MPFAAAWMDLLHEISQKQISYDTTYMQNLKTDKNKIIYQKAAFTDRDNSFLYIMVSQWRERQGWVQDRQLGD